MSPRPPPHYRHALVRAESTPTDSDWLGPRERVIEARFDRPNRRADWRAGRWAAKQLFREGLDQEKGWSSIEILAASDGAPRLWLNGLESSVNLSLSHRGGFAAAATSPDAAPIGIDLEIVEPRSERFVRDFFVDDEVQRWGGLDSGLRDLYAMIVWSAKEGVLKCARTGLRRDTRSVEIDVQVFEAGGPRWQYFRAQDLEMNIRYEGWWWVRGRLLMTLVYPQP